MTRVTKHQPWSLRRSSAAREEGAVLYIVIFVILAATATALIGMQTTQREVASAGAVSRIVLAEHAADTGIAGLQAVMDRHEPAQVDQVIVRRMPADVVAVDTSNYAAGGVGLSEGARFYAEDFAGDWGLMPGAFDFTDVNVESLYLGRLVNYDVTTVVDVEDRYRGPNLPGFAGGDMCMMNYTATARARLGPMGVFDTSNASHPTLRLHASGANARAILTAGPIFYDCP